MTTLVCPAKINLFLAIQKKEPSGYHKINTVFARIDSLCDLIEITKAKKFSFKAVGVPKKNNTVLKTIELLQKITGKEFLYKIVLKKHIPVASGFGGGSSDSASILIYLNQTEKLGFTKKELLKLGAKIGMDVPFFVSEFSTAKGTHYGEKITRLPSLPKNLQITLCHSHKKVSTRTAYAKWDAQNKLNRPKDTNNKYTAKISQMISAIKNHNAKKIIQNLHNDFEQITPVPKHRSFGAKILAGSGGAYAVLHVLSKTPSKTPKSRKKMQS
ncbi:MAG: 4-(cytidine 5'-diphospho)-2-C-methyl-D-erythritol kinase [Candidatus Gracilibacteria bacterium]